MGQVEQLPGGVACALKRQLQYIKHSRSCQDRLGRSLGFRSRSSKAHMAIKKSSFYVFNDVHVCVVENISVFLAGSAASKCEFSQSSENVRGALCAR